MNQMFLNFSLVNTNNTISHEVRGLYIWYHNSGYQFLDVHSTDIKELWTELHFQLTIYQLQILTPHWCSAFAT